MQLLALGRSKTGKQLSVWNVNSFTVFTSQQTPRLPATTVRHILLTMAYYVSKEKGTQIAVPSASFLVSKETETNNLPNNSAHITFTEE